MTGVDFPPQLKGLLSMTIEQDLIIITLRKIPPSGRQAQCDDSSDNCRAGAGSSVVQMPDRRGCGDDGWFAA
jgi:hypothetical protein